MRKSLLLLLALLVATAIPAAAQAKPAERPGHQGARPVQVTFSPRYDRNPSFFRAGDGKYWLFFTRGRNPVGVRGVDGYDPDADSYDIYYKTARSIPGLANAAEKLLPGSDVVNFTTQRDVSALQARDGSIWLFTSSGYAASSDPRIFCYRYDGRNWSGPTAIDGTSYAGHIDAVEYGGRIWLFFDAWSYTLKVTAWNGATWSSPQTIQEKATLAKALVDKGRFYLVWAYIDPDANQWGTYIGLTTSVNGSSWTSPLAIASWPDASATNWDPALVKQGQLFRLFWAPDTGAGGQFIATSASRTPTVQASWSAPSRVTTSSSGANSWWDFWPRPSRDTDWLFYTSERNAAGTDRADGNIWMVETEP